uniref:HD/PDEase domain-containing protein n=1 Tax=Musca domestica TaxID=7370 RepID=A0A1I8N2G4_MUSDO
MEKGMYKYDDVVYGEIYLSEEEQAIVQTPQFQRLKKLKQLGHLKFNNGLEHTHNRFNHCIGTFHAAKLMLDALERNTPWLLGNNNKIPLVYRKAVLLAALLHDVGHGPFSHSWEHVAHNYEHEKIGFACVDKIFATIKKTFFPELRENDNYGVRLIKALIQGKINKLSSFSIELPEKYQFIFEIVSNEHQKIDVDKWDYLKRDHYHLKDICSPDMDFDDVFLQASISQCGKHIQYRYEDYGRIYKLFAARWQFHRKCYLLPNNAILDDILRIAVNETKAKINGVNICEINAENNMAAFLELTDEKVLELIEKHPLSKLLTGQTEFCRLQDNEKLKEVSGQTKIHIPSVMSYLSCDNFQFSGDPKDKPAVTDETETIEEAISFYTDETKIFYKIDILEPKQ